MADRVSSLGDSLSGVENLIGRSPAMLQLKDQIRQIAGSTSTVLVTGESGTGKELVARAIHAASGRRDKPFIGINCGAIPDALLESELFGYKKGAFTARRRQEGIWIRPTGARFSSTRSATCRPTCNRNC